jgi:transmembrane sensor
MDKNRLKMLLVKYLNNTITKMELSSLIDELNFQEYKDIESAVDDLLSNIQIEDKELPELNKRLILTRTLNAISANDDEDVSFEDVRSASRLKWLSIAASILFVLSISLLYLEKLDILKTNMISQFFEREVSLPNSQRAVLSLQDGRSLDLIDADDETLKQEGITIKKDKNGSLTFVISETDNSTVTQNTFSSPKGITSRLLLADGTQAWLNSGASITYPTRFEKKNRKVAVKGEVYFEVSKNANKPFLVNVGYTTIRVLGTQFNVKCLDATNEVYTTLLEGAVEVTTSKEVFKLTPGHQSISNGNSGKIVSSVIDVRSVLDWKSGYFRFSDDDIHSVLNKLSVWYDIQGYTLKEETKDRFTGSVQRTKNLSDLLKQLEKVSDYKFMIKEGRVIVMN